ncbi:hypothetical protein, partial [Acinetobacter baumannii]|uniref:hypothetical protein n=1 Tax=Acinetobacter baumannii TaxID=470 RepID=UPI0024B85F5B
MLSKYFKAAVILAPVLLMSGCFPPGGGKALASAETTPVCAVTIDYLIEVNKDKIVKIHVIEGKAFEKYLTNVNFLR